MLSLEIYIENEFREMVEEFKLFINFRQTPLNEAMNTQEAHRFYIISLK